MKLLFLVSLLLLLAACEANAAPASFNDLPPSIADNARAIELGATADAARIAAEQSARSATEASNAQHAIEGRITAAAQATRDTLSVRATTDAQNATSAAYVADANATANARAAMNNATALAGIAQATETTRVEQREGTATQAAFAQTDTAQRANASATVEALHGTRVSETATATTLAEQAQRTATRAAQLAAVDAAQTEADRNFAQVKAFSWALIPIALLLAIVIFVIVAAFLGVRWYMTWEQTHRLIEKANGVIVITAGNSFGGKPTYEFLKPPAPAQLAAPVHVVEPAESDDMDDMPAPAEAHDATALASAPLNLDELPQPLSLPLGMSHTGARYLLLSRLNHALVAGPTGSGKTTLLHAWVLALLHHAVPAHLVELWLYDGKQGMKFERYKPFGARYVGDAGLPRALADLIAEMNRRYELFRLARADSFEGFNLRDHDQLPRLVFIVDELRAALDRPGALDQILKLMKEGREAGIHLIMATQFVEAKAIPNDVRGNASTRIAFAVPTVHNSLAILGSSGAELLRKQPGRYLMDAGNERVEIQAFTVELPTAPAASAAAPSVFTDLEKKMIQLSAGEGGWFKTRVLAAALGMDDSRITELAQAWEGRGWLSEEKFNVGRKGKNGRALLGDLVTLAQKEGLLPATFKSPLAATRDDLVEARGDMVKTTRRPAKKVPLSA
jgi:hypothetical protein